VHKTFPRHCFCVTAWNQPGATELTYALHIPADSIIQTGSSALRVRLNSAVALRLIRVPKEGDSCISSIKPIDDSNGMACQANKHICAFFKWTIAN
jgi:hypothetical protein